MSVIIDIDFEGGDLTEFTSTVTDSGDLSAAAAAALASTSYGLSCLIDDTNAIYGQFILADAETSGTIRLRFYIDVNSLTMADGDQFRIIGLYNGGGDLCGSFHLKKSGADYQLIATLYNDAGTEDIIGSATTISDEPHYIEYKQVRSTGGNDGTGQWWIDGASAASETNKDNDTRFASFLTMRVGPFFGLDAGTSGTLYLDEIIVNNDGGEIGPVSEATNTPLTVADAAHSHAAESKALSVTADLVTVADAAHAHAVDEPVLAVSAALVVDDAAHAHATEAPALTVAASLEVTDAAHIHAADNITLEPSGLTVLVVADAAHAHAADAPALTARGYLVAADAAHAHAAETPAITLGYILAPANASHTHTSDGVALTGASYLTVADGTHAHQAEAVVLDLPGAGGVVQSFFKGIERAIERGFFER